MPSTLYHVEACPYCEKVRLALALEGIEYESVSVDPTDREPVVKVSGQPKVPVYVDESGDVLYGSNRIIRRLARKEGSGLLPSGRRDQVLAWILVDTADSNLGPLTSRLIRKTDPDGRPLSDDDLKVLSRNLDRALAALEGMLERGPYLFGEKPTAADIAVHAFLNRLEAARRHPIPQDLVRAASWYGRLKAAVGKQPGKVEI